MNVKLADTQENLTNNKLCSITAGFFGESYFIFRVKNVSTGKVEYTVEIS